MRRVSAVALSLLLVLAIPAVASPGKRQKGHPAQKASSVQKTRKTERLAMTFRIDQGITHRHPHPPAGDKNDVFSVVLTLFNMKPAFGKAEDKRVGRMLFSYTLNGTCSAGSGGCRGTTDVTTLTWLPGGTIRAVGLKLPIKTPFVVKVMGGTGRYAGARGRIVIAPGGAARNVYNVTYPARG